ncbi:hypothetical protein GCM10007301_45340 [Azorhizobium oxalatiphilum]|uniref:Uncharacterized protein n=1 Tax=Azorhizobium oxalatiphilum TaxID=980631 RepID=A0A917FIC4_9HYPH|nr:hypothetical protein [Azorhizobium oxalatiphilum]GGF80146.1 hypothetical protein GCM10007301_45340 [Azorhizobium oxalatiphilum]
MTDFAGQPLTQENLDSLFEALKPRILDFIVQQKPWLTNIFIPSPDIYRVKSDAGFMEHSTCSSRDFFHRTFSEICKQIHVDERFHRKIWEWVFITHHLVASGAVQPGKKGLVFGVGQETLPAAFAALGASVTATDAPLAIAQGAGWTSSGEFAQGLAAMPNCALSRPEFERLVEWRECDMNAIADEFIDYDFCWSSCCLEHLGGLRAGMDFIINSVEKTLKIGGIAVHTTEFNLSSNVDTLESGPTVLYRLRDIEDLIRELEDRGHTVEPFRVAPDSLVIDGYVDTPPYLSSPHLKIKLGAFASTSAGLVIRRGV